MLTGRDFLELLVEVSGVAFAPVVLSLLLIGFFGLPVSWLIPLADLQYVLFGFCVLVDAKRQGDC